MPGAQIFNFVNPTDPVGQQMQIEQVQRQQALADALREKSLTALPTNQGPLSPWQGIAQLAQAIAANHINRQAQSQGWNVSAQAANARQIAITPKGQPVNLPYDMTQNPYSSSEQGRNFGQRIGDFIGGGAPISPPRPAAAATLQPSPSGAMPQPVTAAPPMPQSSQLPASPQVGAVAAPVAVPLAATGQIQAPQGTPMPQPPQMPQQGNPQPAQGPVGTGSMSLSGNTAQDYGDMGLNYDAYGKAVIASHTPTDTAKLYNQAQDAAASGNTGLAATLYAQLTKNTNIPDENFRGGSWSKNPTTGVLQYHPTLPEGSAPQLGPNGQVTSVSAIPGASGVEATMAGAKAGGAASGAAPYELVTVTGPDGKPYQVPKSYITGGGPAPAPGTAPAPGGAHAPAPGGGLNDYYKPGGGGSGDSPKNLLGGAPSGLSPAEKAGQEQAAKNSADSFQGIINAGESSKQTRFQISQLLEEAKGLQTGVGASAISHAKSAYNAVSDNLLGGYGGHFPQEIIAKYDSIKKLGAQLAGNQGSGTGTDARLKNAIDGIPNAGYVPEAFQNVGVLLDAKAANDQAKSQAAARWMQSNGPTSYPKFASTWQTVENPDVFYHAAKGDFAQWTKSMSATARAKVTKQYQTYQALGAF